MFLIFKERWSVFSIRLDWWARLAELAMVLFASFILVGLGAVVLGMGEPRLGYLAIGTGCVLFVYVAFSI
jgi:hypothetical protein